MTVLEHPYRTQRITAAKENLITAIGRHRLERAVSQLAHGEWDELLTTAMAYEFERPGAGIDVLRSALRRRNTRRRNAAA